MNVLLRISKRGEISRNFREMSVHDKEGKTVFASLF